MLAEKNVPLRERSMTMKSSCFFWERGGERERGDLKRAEGSLNGDCRLKRE